MAFNFPDGASNGDTHTASNGVVYRFDGTVWVVDRPSTSTSFDAKYLNTTGDGIVSSSAQVTDGSGIISGSTHLFTAVTSSGDISGSGTGSFGILSVGGGIFTSASLAAGGSGVSSYTDLTNVPSGIISGSTQLPGGIISGSAQLPSGIISGSNQLPSGLISGSNQIFTSVTSSGDISGSGTGSFGELEVETNATVDGDLKVSQYIKHKGNETTFINFTDNRIRFKAGDVGFLDMEKDGSTPYPLTVNQGGNRVNFRVVDRNTDLLLKTDSEAFNVGLYHAGNKKLETAAGGINVTGHITSSGDISGSGTGSFGVINVGGGVFTSASLAAGGVSSYTGLTNVPAGIISGSGQLPSGLISGSGQLPSGIISGSSQLPSGTISGSVQITKNSGILSGSITSQLPDGVISGSLQLPSGLISGSTQISESGFVSSSTTNVIEVMTSASYASITPVTGTLYIIQG